MSVLPTLVSCSSLKLLQAYQTASCLLQTTPNPHSKEMEQYKMWPCLPIQRKAASTWNATYQNQATCEREETLGL